MLERSRMVRRIMNQLSVSRRTKIVACLVEGTGIRATARITNTAINTVMNLAVSLGAACAVFQNEIMTKLHCKNIQCDEIWSFVHTKQRNIKEPSKQQRGDVWTWIAMDTETKLVPCWLAGNRDATSAAIFIEGLARRLDHRVQLTTDSNKLYVQAVEESFGKDIDFAQLVKLYGTKENDGRLQYIGSEKKKIKGNPDEDLISTSLIERQNLTMRMGMRRFTRKTNGHSKKLHNHICAIALHFMYYNFGRIHSTLRVTPAMEAGIADHVWGLDEIVGLLKSSPAK